MCTQMGMLTQNPSKLSQIWAPQGINVGPMCEFWWVLGGKTQMEFEMGSPA